MTNMKDSSLLKALMNNDYSREDAQEEISQMIERIYDGEDPEEILYEYGLEPDYVMDLLM
jgi:hypothetical protein